MQAGITRFETAFAGLGGCPFIPGAAGNVSTEDALEMLTAMGIETGLDVDRTILIGKRVEEILQCRGDSYVLRAGRSKDLIPSARP
jgi:hydroxymethylglutaryl-CoA lyase